MSEELRKAEETVRAKLEIWGDEEPRLHKLADILDAALADTEQSEPVAKVIRNAAGQIVLEWTEGDISHHVGETFYTRDIEKAGREG